MFLPCSRAYCACVLQEVFAGTATPLLPVVDEKTGSTGVLISLSWIGCMCMFVAGALGVATSLLPLLLADIPVCALRAVYRVRFRQQLGDGV